MHDAEIRAELEKQKKVNNQLKSAITKIAKAAGVTPPKWSDLDEKEGDDTKTEGE